MTNLRPALSVCMRQLTMVFVLLVIGSCQAPVAKPAVTIVYSPGLDSVCSFIRGGKIQESWTKELKERKKEFENLWATVGPKLINKTEALIGKPFPAKDFTVRLTLCNLPSQSFVGIGINMRHALNSFGSSPVPMRYKVDTLFHELLHKYLSEYSVSVSELLATRTEESTRVRNHLHLLALQKAVLLEVGDLDALSDVIQIDSQLPGGHYKRAWEIVNVTDKEYLRYVAELRK